MKPVASDMSLFFRRPRGQVTEILLSYFDDTLACGDNSFSELTKKTREKFEVKSREYDRMRFSGVYIDKTHDDYETHHWAYIDRLKKFARDAVSLSFAGQEHSYHDWSTLDLTYASLQGN